MSDPYFMIAVLFFAMVFMAFVILRLMDRMDELEDKVDDLLGVDPPEDDEIEWPEFVNVDGRIRESR